MRLHPVILMLLAAAPLTSSPAGFDCGKAATAAEQWICEDPELSRLDELLGVLYAEASAMSSTSGELKREQRRWLRLRDDCPEKGCVIAAYERRIESLRTLVNGSAPEGRTRGRTCAEPVRQLLVRAMDLAPAPEAENPNRPHSPSYFDDLRTGAGHVIPDIAVAFAMAGCWREADLALGAIRTRTLVEEAKAHVSVEMAKAGLYSPAVELMHSLTIEGAVVEARFGIGSALAAAGYADLARSLILAVTTRDNHLESPIYELVSSYVAAGKLEQAQRAIDDAVGREGPLWNARFIVAQAQAKAGRMKDAERNMGLAAREAEDGGEGARDHVALMTSAMYLAGQQTDKAHAAARKIHDTNGRTQGLVAVARHTPDPAAARDVLREALATARRCKGEDCWTETLVVVEGYAAIGDIEQAVNLAKPLETSDLGFEKIVRIQARKGDVAGAEKTLTLLQPGSVGYQGALESIAIAKARAGDHTGARSAFQILRPLNGFVASTVIVGVGSSSPPTRETLEWLELSMSLKHADMQARALQVLMAALARGGDSDRATAWFETHRVQIEAPGRARSLLGIAQGQSGISPGKRWLEVLQK